MIRRCLLTAALAAPLLALVPAAPASAGCAEDYAATMTAPRSYAFVMPNPKTWASVDPATLTVTVNGGKAVSDATGLALVPVVIALSEANYAASATTTLVDCVV